MYRYQHYQPNSHEMVHCSGRTSPPVTLTSSFTQFLWSTVSHVFVMSCMLMSMDSIKLTPCPYSSCDARIDALRVNPRSESESYDVWRSWSCRATLQILQLGIPAPPCDSGICRISRLIFDDACNLWRVGTRTALCSWCIPSFIFNKTGMVGAFGFFVGLYILV